MPFGIQPIHILVVVVVALLIFGPKQLPNIGRWFARTFGELRKSTKEMADTFREESAKMNQELTSKDPLPPATGSSPSSPSPTAVPAAGPAAGSRYCTACGAANPADAAFCAKRGTKLVVVG